MPFSWMASHAVDELEREEVGAVVELTEVGRRGDVLVDDVGARDGLALEARNDIGARVRDIVQELDRHRLAHVDVLAGVDGAHAAFGDACVDAIASR
jgi:hypothetical protein